MQSAHDSPGRRTRALTVPRNAAKYVAAQVRIAPMGQPVPNNAANAEATNGYTDCPIVLPDAKKIAPAPCPPSANPHTMEMTSTSSVPCDHSRKPLSSAPLDFESVASETFQLLGVPELKGCSKKGEELLTHLARADKADARADNDELSRGIRRSLRVEFARSAGLHSGGGTWKKWVADNFGDYGTVRRYSRIARLQVNLANQKLPLIKTTNQGRALLPYADHPHIFKMLREMAATDELPDAILLKAALIDRLGAVRQPAPQDTVVRALRIATKLADVLPEASNDPLLAEMRETVESLLAKLSIATASHKPNRATRRRRRKAPFAASQPELFPLPA